ncbi:MAG: hypothetical protein JXQ81_03865 [Desulfuromonadales bacterium]|nr:hypothetical protein [Desulfuromonadales bacterium]MBN2791626.1 hypothetical protein [Desulfuromonadales bacterium]
MNIAWRLGGGFGLIIFLVMVMYGIFSWETRQISSAYERSSRSIEESSLAEKKVNDLKRKVSALTELENKMQLSLGAVQGAMLSNKTKIESDWTAKSKKSPVEIFIKDTGESIGRDIKNGREWQETLVAGDQEIRAAIAEIDQLWRPRHEGLIDSLSALKRTELNWTLKVANMLFVQSSLGELLFEDISETPLEEFKSGSIYTEFASEVPELKTALEKTAEANKRLYNGVDELDNFAFSSEWEEARLYYRDVFPPNVKTIMVELDNVINLENKILYQQSQAARILDAN